MWAELVNVGFQSGFSGNVSALRKPVVAGEISQKTANIWRWTSTTGAQPCEPSILTAARAAARGLKSARLNTREQRAKICVSLLGKSETPAAVAGFKRLLVA